MLGFSLFNAAATTASEALILCCRANLLQAEIISQFQTVLHTDPPVKCNLNSHKVGGHFRIWACTSKKEDAYTSTEII
jgi:hypothetical protein